MDTAKKYFGAHYRVVLEPDGARRLVGFNFAEETSLGGGNGLVHFWEFDESFDELHKTQHRMQVRREGFMYTETYARRLSSNILMLDYDVE